MLARTAHDKGMMPRAHEETSGLSICSIIHSVLDDSHKYRKKKGCMR